MVDSLSLSVYCGLKAAPSLHALSDMVEVGHSPGQHCILLYFIIFLLLSTHCATCKSIFYIYTACTNWFSVAYLLGAGHPSFRAGATAACCWHTGVWGEGGGGASNHLWKVNRDWQYHYRRQIIHNVLFSIN